MPSESRLTAEEIAEQLAREWAEQPELVDPPVSPDAHRHVWVRAPELDERHIDRVRCACGSFGYVTWSRTLGRRVHAYAARATARLQRQLDHGPVDDLQFSADPSVDRRDEDVLTLPTKWVNVDK